MGTAAGANCARRAGATKNDIASDAMRNWSGKQASVFRESPSIECVGESVTIVRLVRAALSPDGIGRKFDGKMDLPHDLDDHAVRRGLGVLSCESQDWLAGEGLCGYIDPQI